VIHGKYHVRYPHETNEKGGQMFQKMKKTYKKLGFVFFKMPTQVFRDVKMATQHRKTSIQFFYFFNFFKWIGSIFFFAFLSSLLLSESFVFFFGKFSHFFDLKNVILKHTRDFHEKNGLCLAIFWICWIYLLALKYIYFVISLATWCFFLINNNIATFP